MFNSATLMVNQIMIFNQVCVLYLKYQNGSVNVNKLAVIFCNLFHFQRNYKVKKGEKNCRAKQVRFNLFFELLFSFSFSAAPLGLLEMK